MKQNITYENHDALFKIISDIYRDTVFDMNGLEKVNLPKIKSDNKKV